MLLDLNQVSQLDLGALLVVPWHLHIGTVCHPIVEKKLVLLESVVLHLIAAVSY